MTRIEIIRAINNLKSNEDFNFELRNVFENAYDCKEIKVNNTRIADLISFVDEFFCISGIQITKSNTTFELYTADRKTVRTLFESIIDLINHEPTELFKTPVEQETKETEPPVEQETKETETETKETKTEMLTRSDIETAIDNALETIHKARNDLSTIRLADIWRMVMDLNNYCESEYVYDNTYFVNRDRKIKLIHKALNEYNKLYNNNIRLMYISSKDVYTIKELKHRKE